MGSVIAQIVPMMVGAAIVPGWIVFELLLLRRPNGVLASSMYLAGITSVRILQGVTFGAIFASVTSTRDADKTGTIVSTLFLVMGIAMWATAAGALIHRPDAEAPPSHWLTRLESLPAVADFAIGALLVVTALKHWMYTLTSVGIIDKADLDAVESILCYGVYLLGADLLLLIPIAAVASGKAKPKALVSQAGAWLETHSRYVVIAVSILFGSYFVWNGIAGLVD